MTDPENEPIGAAQEGPKQPASETAPSVSSEVAPPVAPAEQDAADAAVLRESRKHTRRSFAIAAVSAAAGYGIYQWIDHSQRLSMQPMPLRRAFQANAKLSRAIFDDRALAPTYPLKRAEDLRVNGVYGLKQNLVPESWRLQLTGVANATKLSPICNGCHGLGVSLCRCEKPGRPGPRHEGGSQRGHGREDGAGIDGCRGKNPPGARREDAARAGGGR
jgi:hypothetical protein